MAVHRVTGQSAPRYDARNHGEYMVVLSCSCGKHFAGKGRKYKTAVSKAEQAFKKHLHY